MKFDGGGHNNILVLIFMLLSKPIGVEAETPPGSEFLSLLGISVFSFYIYSRLLVNFLSHLGKWVKLIKFEAENECFCTWKVEKPQYTTYTP